MRLVIDKHFTENINYYKKICRSYYNNYLAEDLLQEAYLKFAEIPGENIKSTDTAYLKHFGKKIIASLFQKRKVCKVRSGSQTSNLFIVNYGNLEIDGDFGSRNFQISEGDDYNKKQFDELSKHQSALICTDEIEVEKKIEKENRLAIVTDNIFDSLASEDFDTGVFVMSQIESVNAMSKRMNMDRTYLKRIIDNKKEQLKKLIA